MPDAASNPPSTAAHRRTVPGRPVLAAVAATIVAAAAVRRARRTAAVTPELRSSFLFAPVSLNGPTRAIIRQLASAAPPPPAGVHMATRHVPRGAGEPATRLLLFERGGASGRRPVLFWMHGGDYVIGRPEQDMSFVARLLARFDMVVASVDYRLAPEHPFPVPLDECHAALAWLVDQADSPRIDPARIVIGGQSAGGGLAAALVQRTVDQRPVASRDSPFPS